MRHSLTLLLLFGLVLPATAAEPTYVGNDLICAGCHNPANPGDEYGFFPGAKAVDFDAYMDSGHPWKVRRTYGIDLDLGPSVDPLVEAYPYTPFPPLPVARGNQLVWADVEYIIGNFFWKARFIDRDGYIWTGDAGETTQWNIATQAWANYHGGEFAVDDKKVFNCGKCHTTGYDPAGHQGGDDGGEPCFPGLIGTWSQDGVRCEACHGPASAHLVDLEVHPTGGKGCGDCHQRDFTETTQDWRMPWKNGFMRHHQQAEDLSHSPHSQLGCNYCHDPHRSVVYDDGGVKPEAACTECHNVDGLGGKTYEVNIASMTDVECIDCHMPKMTKSATADGFKADVRGHLFRIMTDPIAAVDNVVEADGSPSTDGSGFWKQDPDGKAFATLDYACLSCHVDAEDDVARMAEFAAGIHDFPQPPGDNWRVEFPLTGAPGVNVEFSEFAGYLMVDITGDDGSASFGIGFEMNGMLIWIDVFSREIYIGFPDRTAGEMSGFVLGEGPNKGSTFLAEAQ